MDTPIFTYPYRLCLSPFPDFQVIIEIYGFPVAGLAFPHLQMKRSTLTCLVRLSHIITEGEPRISVHGRHRQRISTTRLVMTISRI